MLQQRGANARNVRAVTRNRALADLRPRDLERNLRELVVFADTESFRKLAEAFKRVRNIARDLPQATPDDSASLRAALKEPAELALVDAIDERAPAIEAAVLEGGAFRAAYAAAAGFEPIVAKFFNEVFVMTDDMPLRHARLALMKRLESLILRLGDISEIVAPES